MLNITTESRSSEIKRIEMQWKILFFIPILILGILFQYGIQY